MLKSLILWNYERGTWPYDIFCLLIVAFIFLTPKTWFEKRDVGATPTLPAIVQREAFLPGEDSFMPRGSDISGGRLFAANKRNTREFAREINFTLSTSVKPECWRSEFDSESVSLSPAFYLGVVIL